MQIIAHRGASKHAPENTLEAFTFAHRQGVCFIECDVAMSQDGVLLIIHDTTLNRTTNGCGTVWKTLWNDLSQLDAGSWFSFQYHQARIPSLHDLIQWHRKHPGIINLELKTIDKEKIPFFLDELFKVMEHVENIDDFVFSSFQFELLEALKKQKKNWQIAALSMQCNHSSIQKAQRMGCQLYSTSVKSCKLSWVKKIHAAGMQVGVFTVNEKDILQKLKKWGVDFVFTDNVFIIQY